MRHITAAPFDQHLAIEEDGGKCTELLDDKGTLSAQGVAPNASLLVWVSSSLCTTDLLQCSFFSINTIY